MNFNHPILESIRERPAMHLGRPSLIRLRAFVAGYMACEYDNRLVPYKESETAEFCEWLGKRRKMPASLGYVGMLLAVHDGDDAAAYHDFWSCLDEYRAEKNSEEK